MPLGGEPGGGKGKDVVFRLGFEGIEGASQSLRALGLLAEEVQGKIDKVHAEASTTGRGYGGGSGGGAGGGLSTTTGNRFAEQDKAGDFARWEQRAMESFNRGSDGWAKLGQTGEQVLAKLEQRLAALGEGGAGQITQVTGSNRYGHPQPPPPSAPPATTHPSGATSAGAPAKPQSASGGHSTSEELEHLNAHISHAQHKTIRVISGSLRALTHLAEGMATMGLADKETSEDILKGFMKVHGFFQSIIGVLHSVESLSRAGKTIGNLAKLYSERRKLKAEGAHGHAAQPSTTGGHGRSSAGGGAGVVGAAVEAAAEGGGVGGALAAAGEEAAADVASRLVDHVLHGRGPNPLKDGRPNKKKKTAEEEAAELVSNIAHPSATHARQEREKYEHRNDSALGKTWDAVKSEATNRVTDAVVDKGLSALAKRLGIGGAAKGAAAAAGEAGAAGAAGAAEGGAVAGAAGVGGATIGAGLAAIVGVGAAMVSAVQTVRDISKYGIGGGAERGSWRDHFSTTVAKTGAGVFGQVEKMLGKDLTKAITFSIDHLSGLGLVCGGLAETMRKLAESTRLLEERAKNRARDVSVNRATAQGMKEFDELNLRSEMLGNSELQGRFATRLHFARTPDNYGAMYNREYAGGLDISHLQEKLREEQSPGQRLAIQQQIAMKQRQLAEQRHERELSQTSVEPLKRDVLQQQVASLESQRTAALHRAEGVRGRGIHNPDMVGSTEEQVTARILKLREDLANVGHEAKELQQAREAKRDAAKESTGGMGMVMGSIATAPTAALRALSWMGIRSAGGAAQQMEDVTKTEEKRRADAVSRAPTEEQAKELDEKRKKMQEELESLNKEKESIAEERKRAMEEADKINESEIEKVKTIAEIDKKRREDDISAGKERIKQIDDELQRTIEIGANRAKQREDAKEHFGQASPLERARLRGAVRRQADRVQSAMSQEDRTFQQSVRSRLQSGGQVSAEELKRSAEIDRRANEEAAKHASEYDLQTMQRSGIKSLEDAAKSGRRDRAGRYGYKDIEDATQFANQRDDALTRAQQEQLERERGQVRKGVLQGEVMNIAQNHADQARTEGLQRRQEEEKQKELDKQRQPYLDKFNEPGKEVVAKVHHETKVKLDFDAEQWRQVVGNSVREQLQRTLEDMDFQITERVGAILAEIRGQGEQSNHQNAERNNLHSTG